LAKGLVYPRLDLIRQVSAKIAAGVAAAMHDSGRASLPRPAGDMLAHCEAAMYKPSYDVEIV
jgi:malic enzyme